MVEALVGSWMMSAEVRYAESLVTDLQVEHVRAQVAFLRSLDAEHLFNAPTMVFGMRLRADDQSMQPGIATRIEPFFLEYVEQSAKIAGNGVRHAGAKVTHQLDLAQAVSGASRNAQTAELFGAILEPETAGK